MEALLEFVSFPRRFLARLAVVNPGLDWPEMLAVRAGPASASFRTVPPTECGSFDAFRGLLLALLGTRAAFGGGSALALLGRPGFLLGGSRPTLLLLLSCSPVREVWVSLYGPTRMSLIRLHSNKNKNKF